MTDMFIPSSCESNHYSLTLDYIEPEKTSQNTTDDKVEQQCATYLSREQNQERRLTNIREIEHLNQEMSHGRLQEISLFFTQFHPDSSLPPKPNLPNISTTGTTHIPLNVSNVPPQEFLDFFNDFIEAKKVHKERLKKINEWHKSTNAHIKHVAHLLIIKHFLYLTNYNEFTNDSNQNCRFTKDITTFISLLFYAFEGAYNLLTVHYVAKPLERRYETLKDNLSNERDCLNQWKGLTIWQDKLQSSAQNEDLRKILKKAERLGRKYSTSKARHWIPSTIFSEEIRERITSKICRHTIQTFCEILEINSINEALARQQQWRASLYLSPKQSLKVKKDDFEGKVIESIESFIKPRLLQWQAMSFEDIQRDCVKLGIDLNTLPHPPQNQVEWTNVIATDDFQRELAEQYVKHCHEIGKLIKQVVKRALLNKSHVEENALNYCKYESYLTIILGIAKIILAFPSHLHAYPASELIISTLFNDAVKDANPLVKRHLPQIGFINALRPHLHLKIIDIFPCRILRHIGNASYKPHEYSFKGYELSLKKESVEFCAWTYQRAIELIQCLIGLSKILADNYIPGLSKDDPLFVQIECILTQEHSNGEQWIKNFEKQLDELRLKDIEPLFHPQASIEQKESGLFEDLLQKIQTFNEKKGIGNTEDPLQIIEDALSHIDVKYVKKSTREFFLKQISQDLLINSPHEVQSKLKDIFCSKGQDFVNMLSTV